MYSDRTFVRYFFIFLFRLCLFLLPLTLGEGEPRVEGRGYNRPDEGAALEDRQTNVFIHFRKLGMEIGGRKVFRTPFRTIYGSRPAVFNIHDLRAGSRSKGHQRQ